MILYCVKLEMIE